jgi:hypothetical protein
MEGRRPTGLPRFAQVNRCLEAAPSSKTLPTGTVLRVSTSGSIPTILPDKNEMLPWKGSGDRQPLPYDEIRMDEKGDRERDERVPARRSPVH